MPGGTASIAIKEPPSALGPQVTHLFKVFPAVFQDQSVMTDTPRFDWNDLLPVSRNIAVTTDPLDGSRLIVTYDFPGSATGMITTLEWTVGQAVGVKWFIVTPADGRFETPRTSDTPSTVGTKNVLQTAISVSTWSAAELRSGARQFLPPVGNQPRFHPPFLGSGILTRVTNTLVTGL